MGGYHVQNWESKSLWPQKVGASDAYNEELKILKFIIFPHEDIRI